MALTVASFTPYLSFNSPVRPRQKDWPPIKFVQALKGKPIKGWAHIPVRGGYYRLEQENAELSLAIFAEMASNYLVEKKVTPPVVLVPVPNSSCTIDSGIAPRTVALANALAGRLKPASVWDCLRWIRDVGSASAGTGTRDPQELYDALVLTEEEMLEGTYILIDDVKTTGGHLQACRAVLAEAECDLAVCGGRTVWDHTEEPFTFREEEVEDWWPTQALAY